MAHSVRSSLVSATLYSLAGLVALGATRLLYSAIVGRAFGPAVLGDAGQAIAIATVASLFGVAGPSSAVPKFAALTGSPEGPHSLAMVKILGHWAVVRSVVTTAGLLILARWIVPHYSLTEQLLLVLLLATYSAYTFLKSRLYGAHRAARYARYEILSDIGTVGTAVAIAIYHLKLVLLPMVLGYALFSLMAMRSAPRRRVLVSIPVDRQREMRAFVRIATVGGFASFGFLQLSMVASKQQTSSVQAGYYAAALSIASAAYFLPRALGLVIFPSMADAHGRGDHAEIGRMLDRATTLLVVVMTPVFAGAVLLARPLMRLMYGVHFEGADMILVVLLAATYVSVIQIPAVNSLSSVEHRFVKVSAVASCGGLAIGVAWWAIFRNEGHGVDIALGYLLGSLLQAAIPMVIAWKKYGLPFTPLCIRLLAGAATVATLKTVTDDRGVGSDICLVAAVGFAIAWLACDRAGFRFLSGTVRTARRDLPYKPPGGRTARSD